MAEEGTQTGTMNHIANYTYLLPNFDGSPNSDVRAFFAQFENIATLGQWTPQQKTVLLKSKLSGVAAKYLFNNPEVAEIQDFAELKKNIIHFFSVKPSIVRQQTLFTQCKQQPHENVKNFAYRVSLATRNYIGEGKNSEDETHKQMIEKLKFAKFMEGLEPALKIECLKANVNSFEEAIEHAEKLESIIKAMQDNEQVTVNNILATPEGNSQELTPSQVQKEQQEINTEIINTLKGLQRLNISNNERDSTQPKAKKVDNRQKKQIYSNNERENTGRIYCHYCMKTGHIMKDCWYFNREIRSYQTQNSQENRTHNTYRNQSGYGNYNRDRRTSNTYNSRNSYNTKKQDRTYNLN